MKYKHNDGTRPHFVQGNRDSIDIPAALADKSTLACKTDELNDIMSRDAIGAATIDVWSHCRETT